MLRSAGVDSTPYRRNRHLGHLTSLGLDKALAEVKLLETRGCGLPRKQQKVHWIEPPQREKLERLCRYASRPPIAVERLALTSSGQVRHQLKTPYRDGTTHIVLDPLDLMAALPRWCYHRGCI